MPPGQRLATGNAKIGAGIWQPIQFLDIFRGERETVPDLLVPPFVILAPAGTDIQKAACDAGDEAIAGFFVFQLHKAALAAAVAQALPF